MEITPEVLIPYIIVGICIVGLIWALVQNRKSINPDKADSIVTALYSLAKKLYTAISNDGKIDQAELQGIFEQIKVILAILQKKNIETIDDEFRPIDYIEE